MSRTSVPLPWERLLWRGRSAYLPHVRFALTDFRVVRMRGDRRQEIALHHVADVRRHRSAIDRLFGASTITIHAERAGRTPLVLRGVRGGAQVAALIELLSGDPHAAANLDAIRAALHGDPRPPAARRLALLAAVAMAVLAVAVAAAGLGGGRTAAPYASDDPIAPDGHKRSRIEIEQFMQRDVMPWAQAALGPLVGGASRVSCRTCHGADAAGRRWQMPAVARLPLPRVVEGGWERYSGTMDAQLRNAIYGYVAADSGRQTTATYMREVVLPGMARLLHRQPYDFTRSYEYNRAHRAFGCYHCHRVK